MNNVDNDQALLSFGSNTLHERLRRLNLFSFHEIALIERERFKLDYDIALNGSAGAIHDYAVRQVMQLDGQIRSDGFPATGESAESTFAQFQSDESSFDSSLQSAPVVGSDKYTDDTWYRVARHKPALYPQLFKDGNQLVVDSGDIQSLDSPVSYLVYLLCFLGKVQSGEALTRLFKRRPDLRTLGLDYGAFTDPHSSAKLAAEVLLDAIKAITEVSGKDALAVYKQLAFQAKSPFILPFDCALSRIQLTLETLKSTVGDVVSRTDKNYLLAEPKRNAQIAYSGLSTGQQAVLVEPPAETDVPFVLEFTERGRLIGPRPQFLLSSVWPDIAIDRIDKIKLQSNGIQNVKCKAVGSGQTTDVNLSLKLIQVAPNEVVVSPVIARADSASIGTCWGTAQFTVSCAGSSQQAVLNIGLLLRATKGRQSTKVLDASRQRLRTFYGEDVASAVATAISLPVAMLCQAAHITREELDECFALGKYAPKASTLFAGTDTPSPGHYGAAYVWGAALSNTATPPGTIIHQELKCTGYQLDRLHRLLSLKQWSGMSVGQLDWLLQAAIQAEKANTTRSISRETIRALGVFRRLQVSRQISVDEFAALLWRISPYSQQQELSLLDKLFTPTIGEASFKLDGKPLVLKTDIPILARAFGISQRMLEQLITNVTNFKTTTDLGTPSRTLAFISAIYRPVALAKMFSIDIADCQNVISFLFAKDKGENIWKQLLGVPSIGAAPFDLLDALLTLDECGQWCQQHSVPMADMARYTRHVSEQLDRDKRIAQHLCEAVKDLSFATFSIGKIADYLAGSGTPEFAAAFEKDEKLKASLTQGVIKLATILAQETKVVPGVAGMLVRLGEPLLEQILKNGAHDLSGLFLWADVVHRYDLNEAQLQPLLNQANRKTFALGPIEAAANWPTMQALHAYARWVKSAHWLDPIAFLAGSETDRLKMLSEHCLASLDDVKEILNSTGLWRLQRLHELSQLTGWSVVELSSLNTLDLTKEASWDVLVKLADHCGPNSGESGKALAQRIDEVNSAALLTYYKAISRDFTVVKHGMDWRAVYDEKEPNTLDVARQLLIDPEATAKVASTRVAEAIASVQAYTQRIVQGAEPGLKLTPGELKRWRENDSRYAVWAANMQLRWHPEQYVNPVARIRKTKLFKQLETHLSQARLDNDSVQQALSAYLRDFERIANLDVVGAYQDGLDPTQNTIYFLGKTKSSPYGYYWRSWGMDGSGLRVWSEWESIEIPNSENTASSAHTKEVEGIDTTGSGYSSKVWFPVSIRLVTMSGRLYFVWVENREIQQAANLQDVTNIGAKEEGSNKLTVGIKSYQHVVRISYRQLGGGWSAPVNLFSEEASGESDPLVHLTAFTVPAGGGMNWPSGFRVKPVDGDQLMIALFYSNKRDAKQTGVYRIFDGFLTEVSTDPLRLSEEQHKEISPWRPVIGSAGFWEKNDRSFRIVQGLVYNSYRWIIYGDEESSDTYYSTGIMTPCVPNAWLFADRQIGSHGRLTFGEGLTATLSVVGAGQINRNDYIVESTASVAAAILKKMPSDKKLVHFIEMNGVSKYVEITSDTQDTQLQLWMPFDQGQSIYVSNVRHGLVLAERTINNVVLTEDVDDAYIESGVLTVSHGEPQEMAGSIRENQEGVQYLQTKKKGQEASGDQTHSIHGIKDPLSSSLPVTVAGVDSKVVVASDKTHQNSGLYAQLQSNAGWMASQLLADCSASMWDFNLTTADTNDRKTVWFVTRCPVAMSTSLQPSLYQGDTSQVLIEKAGVITPVTKASEATGADKLFLCQKADVSDLKLAGPATKSIALWQPKTANTWLQASVQFCLLTEVTTDQPVTLKDVTFRIFSADAFDAQLKTIPAQKPNVFVLENEGWVNAEFIRDAQPSKLTRNYNLASSGKHYFVIKVLMSAGQWVRKGERYQWCSTWLGASSSAAVVMGLQKSLKTVDTFRMLDLNKKTDAQEAGFSLEKDNQVCLTAPNEMIGNAFLEKYSCLFIALPWSVAQLNQDSAASITFKFENLGGREYFFGKVDCNFAPLARTLITTQCSRNTLAVGNQAQLLVNVDTRAESANLVGGTVTVSLAPELRVDSPLVTPEGTVLATNSTTGGRELTLKLAPHIKIAEFKFPVTLLDYKVVPSQMGKVEVQFGASRQGVDIPLPAIIPNVQQLVEVDWEWWYGNDLKALNKVEVNESTSRLILNNTYFFAAFTLKASESAFKWDKEIMLALRVPEGMSPDPDYKSQQDHDKLKAIVGGAFVPLNEQWSQPVDGQLRVTPQNYKTTQVQSVFLVPLKVDGKTPFLNALQATLSALAPNVKGQWTLFSNIFEQPDSNHSNQLELAGRCESPSGYLTSGDVLDYQLTLQGGDTPPSISSVSLELPKEFSFAGSVATFDRDAGQPLELVGTINSAKRSLTFNNVPTLSAKELATLKIPVVAQPSIEPGSSTSNQTAFHVEVGGRVSNIPIGMIKPRLRVSEAGIVATDRHGVPFSVSKRLPVGQPFQYQIALNLSQADIEAQLGKATWENSRTAGVVVVLSLSPSLEFNPADDRGIRDYVRLPLLMNKDLQDRISQSSRKLPVEVTVTRLPSAALTTSYLFHTVLSKEDLSIAGSIAFPVKVVAPGACYARLEIKVPSAGVFKSVEWQGLSPYMVETAPIPAFDPRELAVSDVHFGYNEYDDEFSNPIVLPRPILIGDQPQQKNSDETLVRLNTQFGKTLARIAQHNVEAVFQASTQEHVQAALKKNTGPELLEKDSANLAYFWELFLHVPLLVAYKLNLDGRHEEAQDWLQRLFEPFPSRPNPTENNYWRCRLLTAKFSAIPPAMVNGAVDPDLIASHQPELYRKAVFFAYVKNLMDWGDSHFRVLSRDSLNEARQCYMLALELMGAPQSTGTLATWKASDVQTAINGYAQSQGQRSDAQFKIPRSRQFRQLWDGLSTRLSNLRNGLSLDGKLISLPIYDAPLNPAQLLAARSVPGSSSATQLSRVIQVPLYRYSVMYGRALNAVELLIQFGNSLLSMTERQEGLQQEVLLVNQQREISVFLVDMQKETLRLSKENRKGLEAMYQSALSRYQIVCQQISEDVSQAEKHALSLRQQASNIGSGASAARMVGAVADLFPNVFGLANGGSRYGGIAYALADGLSSIQEQLSGEALQVEIGEQYRRRLIDLKTIGVQVEHEVKQLQAQLDADDIQHQLYEKQLIQVQTQRRHLEEQTSFMRGRFTNEALYQWMVGQTSALYYQAYDTISSLCLQAQDAWRYEVGDYQANKTFFQMGGWDSLHRGLLAGEGLKLGLLRMDNEYLTRSERRLEITHTLSVKEAIWDVAAVTDKTLHSTKEAYWKHKIQLEKTNFQGADKNTALPEDMLAKTLKFRLSEADLAKRYPGLYKRQLVAVTVTLPGLLGPYQDICAILTLISSKFSLVPTPAACTELFEEKMADMPGLIIANLRPNQAIALSSGMDDSGMFVLNFGDEKLLPFEGNGACSEWELKFMAPYGQQILLQSLTDVVIRFHYQASDGGDVYAKVVMNKLFSKDVPFISHDGSLQSWKGKSYPPSS
ncbi:hypothetical protein C4K04_2674 [Pseudomonas chlororaphis]|uniref:Uncharacterized protein n=1 Tax=Pseudomonas chlororaphis TaxID=587753 RepID=A0A3G7TQ35_9PSED|nr:neuraminidase-like domain-containing protein [Pseudomonas chlororaphis]AZE48346.1 hypothetical protein C4K04_2674 [Pseudomonas chlororaphis]